MEIAVRTTNLTKKYKLGETEVHALNGVDLTVYRGEFVALVGPSGSGKSTVLHLIGGLDHPTSGEIHVNGVSLHTCKESELTAHRRTRVGFVFQSFNLLPHLTAQENAALPLMFNGVGEAVRLHRAAQLLSQIGLGDRLAHRPTQLSGGEQQRVAIARALITEPEILLADEPTGNLDSQTGAEIMTLLRSLNQQHNLTLLVVTHDAAVADFADRVVHLRDGTLICTDKH